MAAGNLKSTQETNRTAVPVVMGGPNEKGKLRAAYFSGTITGTDLDIGTVIALVRLPAGARVFGGYWYNSADLGVALTTLNIGDATVADRFVAVRAIADAVDGFSFPLDAVTGGTGGGVALSADTTILASNAGGVFVAAGTYKGFILYVLD